MRELLKPFKGLPQEIYILCLARLINAAGLFIYPLLTLIMTRKIGLTESESGFWLMLSGLMFIPSSLLGGKLTDRFGRKRLILAADTAGGLLYILCGFTEPSMVQIWLILVACFCLGLAEPAHNAIIADLTTPENRDGAYSLSYMCFNMGFAVGPAIGGRLFEHHYPWIFWGDALTLLTAMVLLQLFVRETFGEARLDPGEGRALERHVSGSIWRVLWDRPILVVFSGILLLYNFAYAQWHYLLPLQLSHQFRGEGAALFGLLASLNGVVVMVCTPVLTALSRQMGPLRRIALGGVLYGAGFGMFGLISGRPFLYFAVACVLFTLGEILIATSFMPFVTNRTPASHRGRMDAVLPMIMGVGYSTGPLLMGKGLTRFSIETGWQLIAGVMVLGVLAMTTLERWDNREGKTAENVI